MTRGRKPLFWVALVGALLVAAAAQGEDGKIGVVDLDQAINSTDEGKKAREEFARKQRDANQQVQPMVDRFKELREELEGKKYVLSDEALFSKQADLMELKNKIDNKLEELKGQLQIDQQRLEAPLRSKLYEIIQEIGKDRGFTLIISRNTPGVIYSREALDITDDVVKRFNKKRG